MTQFITEKEKKEFISKYIEVRRDIIYKKKSLNNIDTPNFDKYMQLIKNNVPDYDVIINDIYVLLEADIYFHRIMKVYNRWVRVVNKPFLDLSEMITFTMLPAYAVLKKYKSKEVDDDG